MRYPEFLAQHLPIGSCVFEATCRSLVCQRTKDAGMRWTRSGAQAILNLRRVHLATRYAGHPASPRSGGHSPRQLRTGSCYHHRSASHPGKGLRPSMAWTESSIAFSPVWYK